MNLSKALVATALLLGSQSGLLAGAIRHDRDNGLYKTMAADPRYGTVGIVRGDGFGSGTLIASEWVVTAAHMGAPEPPSCARNRPRRGSVAGPSRVERPL